MQWLSAPKLADMLNKVMPPLKDVMEEEAPAETPQLPWTLASPSEGSDDMQRELQSRMLELHKHPEVFQKESVHAGPVDLSGHLGNTAGDVLKVDAGLRQLRFRIVPRHVNEERFWGRYFAACASIRAEVLQQQPSAAAPSPAGTAPSRRADSSTGAATPAAQRSPAVPASISQQSGGCSSYAARDMHASDAAAAVMPVPASPAAVAQMSNTGGRDESHSSGAAAGSPRALWPDMTSSRFLGDGSPSLNTAAAASQPARRRVVNNPRRFTFSLGAATQGSTPVHSRSNSGEGSDDSHPRQPYLDGSLLADLREGAPQQPWLPAALSPFAGGPPPPHSSAGPASARGLSLFCSGPPSTRGGSGMSRQVSCGTISSDSGFSDWSHVSDQFGPLGRELAAASSQWMLVNRA